MFGYVTPHKPELKMREYTLYQAYDCGLCRTIGARYGQLPRLALSYDCVFLALLAAGLEPGLPCCPRRCAYKPLAPKRPMAQLSPALEYAADVNVLLSYYQAWDHWADERSVQGLGGRLLLARAARRARILRSDLDGLIRRGLEKLSRLERERCADLDAPADAFGGILAGITGGVPGAVGDTGRVLAELGREVGRWIYWMDAWDDRARDEKNGGYNPFLAADAGRERAALLLHVTLNRARQAYQLLELSCNRGVLDNILFDGMEQRTLAVLGHTPKGGTDEQSL